MISLYVCPGLQFWLYRVPSAASGSLCLESKIMLTEDKVKDALSKVIDPDLNVDIVTLGMISGIKIDGRKVLFTLTLTTPACPVKEKLEQECKDAVNALEGVESIEM